VAPFFDSHSLRRIVSFNSLIETLLCQSLVLFVRCCSGYSAVVEATAYV